METASDEDAIAITVSSRLLSALRPYAAELGMDLEAIAARIGLGSELGSEGPGRLPLERFRDLWEAVRDASRDEDFGLRVAGLAVARAGRNDPLIAILRNSATIGKAIENLVAYHDLATNLIKVELRVADGLARFSWRARPGSALASERHLAEAVMVVYAFLLADLSDGAVRASAVDFAHARPPRTEEHARMLGLEPRFGRPRNELRFDAACLALPVPSSDPEFLAHLERYAIRTLERMGAAGDYSAQAARVIAGLLASGEKPTLARVAGELGMGARALQGRLKAEGRPYQAVLDGIRREIALEELESPRPSLSEIAFLLGFSEQSSFNRAFRKWTGMPPRSYLEARRR